VQLVLLSVAISAHSARTPPVGSGRMSLALVSLASEVEARVRDARVTTACICDQWTTAIENHGVSVRPRSLRVRCASGKQQRTGQKTHTSTSHYSLQGFHLSSSFLLPLRRPPPERSLGTSPKSTRPLGGRSRSADQQSVGAGCLFAGTPFIQMRHIPGGG
jgi:hypothetical protein